MDGRGTWEIALPKPLRGSDTSATTGWTEGKPWEIAWGELFWEGATRKRGHDGHTHRGFCREKPFMQRSLDIEELLHREVLTLTHRRFTHRSFYTQTRLHTEGFTNRGS